ncbi:MAG: type II secretion system F family protein [Patescibacteria group bacterium]
MKYDFLASTKDGKIRDGDYEAVDKEGVLAYLASQTLTPISIKERKRSRLNIGSITIFSTLSIVDKMLISRNLSSMISSGVDILEAVDILYEDAEKPTLRKIFSTIKFDLEKGLPLSSAFAKYPKFFSDAYINTIKSGEESGTLEKTFKDLELQLKKENELFKKIRSAIAYPILLLIVSFSIVILLIIFVLPKLTKVFTQSGVKLPVPTQILLNISSFISSNWFLILLFFIISFIVVKIFKKTRIGKIIIYNLISHIPLLGILVKKVILSRLARILSALLKSGTPIVRSLKISADASANILYKEALNNIAEKEISKGATLGGSLRHRPELFPRMFVSLVSVGEKTGSVDNVFESIADFYEDEVEESLKSLVSVLEPLLLIIMGFIVGSIAISVILPIYGLVGSF